MNLSRRSSILAGVESRVPSDAELVRLARTGEAAALAGLLERYRPSLYAAAIGVLHNRDDAHDAVQDTLLVALAKLDALRDPAAVGGWLHQVLRNTCLMFPRRAVRTAEAADVLPREPVPSAETVVEGLALRDWIWAPSTRSRPTIA